MKIKSDMWQVNSDKRKLAARELDSCHPSPVTAAGLQPSTFNLQPSRRGFALVITLILLSVTLIMAIAFLAISRRERGSVVTTTDTATARYAADAALASAEAQIISTALGATNPYINNLLVSTNYINANGFTTGSANPTNVNYNYANGNFLSPQDFLQNVANLQFLPRVPVFVPTNALGASDFRFYLDLNRNGNFEDTDVVTNYDNFGKVIVDNSGNAVTNFQTGDPQWIGVLERPDAPHGPNNKFVARYAFIAQPANGTLDLNYIHNQALHGNNPTQVNPLPPGVNDVYFRNQGVGSWEFNLAAFLADLNTNQWDSPTVENPVNNPYFYNPPPAIGGNTGAAFEDARALLAYRYNNTFGSLAFLPTLYPNYPLTGGPVDIVPFGPTLTGTGVPFYNYGIFNNYRWPGADSTNHFFALASDLFDPNKNSVAFTNHLVIAGNGLSTYDRYTFYRLLAQLGTDSSPDTGKMNLNYDNLDPFRFNLPLHRMIFSTNGVSSVTNFVAWTPLAFFTNAADRMLRLYTTNWFQANPPNYLATYYGFTNTGGYYTNNPGQYFYVDGLGNTINYDRNGSGLTNIPLYGLTNQIPAFGLTNIPVYINGQIVYHSAVQRVLQLAANIYDASVTNFYPSVFRPLFTRINKNVYVSGYTNVSFVSSSSDPQLFIQNQNDAGTFSTLSGNVFNVPINIYGIPWIIGAKKGLPNFNEFSMQDVVQMTRLLQVKKPAPNASPNATNQMYLFGITNSLGVEFWNSYTNGYSNQVQVVVNDSLTMQMALTNGTFLALPFNPNPSFFALNIFTNVIIWPGRSFVLPLNTNVMFLPNSQYDFKNERFDYVGDNPDPSFGSITPYALANLPQMLLQVTNRIQAFVLDGNHVIDYVSFAGPQSTRNLNSEIFNTNTTVIASPDSYFTNLIWSTAPDGLGNPLGVDSQIGLSDGSIALKMTAEGQPLAPYWKSAPGWNTSVGAEIDGFRYFLNPANAILYGTSRDFLASISTNLAVQVPYAPTISTYEYISWQANDPLVHYLQSDLYFSGADPKNASSGIQTGVHQMAVTTTSLPLLPDLGLVNVRYEPWGITPPTTGPESSQANYDQNPFNLAFKDPLMTQSDNWDFPTNKYPTVGWLGRVHRGTPWQTVYLKAHNILKENVGTNTWAIWTGNYSNVVDAANSAPTQDRLLFDIFTTAINDNASRGRLSVNVAANSKDPAAGLAAWSALFSGMVALTNTTTFPQFSPLINLPVIIQPAGPAGTNSLLGQIVVGINNMRAAISNSDGVVGAFEHVGEILATPQLTEASPFLNTNSVIGATGKPIAGSQQPLYGISDEMYEWLPQQTLSLLSASAAPSYVIYCYGQALKPAPNGVVTGGPNLANGVSPFGMVTNYQVVAETATRVVVQFQPVVVTNSVTGLIQTNYSATLEQFNPLPPD